ncbi:condensation domain-containing protein [Streptomyces lydicus]|nr:condensation domain-containing protein [Streptomyces lydicus]
MARASQGSARGAVERFVVPAGLSARVHDFAREHRLTVNAVLQAALHTLLHRLTGEERIAVGTPSANRGRAAWLDVVGYFVNVLPLAARFGPKTTFADAATGLQQTLAAALEHGELPYAAMLRAGGRAGDRCNVLVAYQSIQSEHSADIARIALEDSRLPVRVGGLTVLPVPLPRRDNAFDLTLNLADSGAELLGNAEYRSDLFAAGDVRQFIDCYLGLLGSALADPGRPVADLSLSAAAPATTRALSSPAADGAYDEVCLPELVEQWFRRTPDAPALADGVRTLSYRELDRAAGRVAAELSAHGAGPESVVGVLTGRDVRTVIAVLGVLKAGRPTCRSILAARRPAAVDRGTGAGVAGGRGGRATRPAGRRAGGAAEPATGRPGARRADPPRQPGLRPVHLGPRAARRASR